MAESEKSLLLLGAGAHGRVCMDIALTSGYEAMGFLDDNSSLHGTEINAMPVLGAFEQWREVVQENTRLVICVGNCVARERLVDKLAIPPERFSNLIHHSSVLLPSAKIGRGAMIFTHTHIGANAMLGHHVIVNNGVVIDHDCSIGDFASISPGAVMGGRVAIGKGVFVGVGVSFRPGVRVGEGSIIGAGAAVVGDIPPRALAYGVPARVVGQVKPEDWEKI